MSNNYRSIKNLITSVTHHGLIKIIVLDALSHTCYIWEHFIHMPQIRKEENPTKEDQDEDESIEEAQE
jgi:hypothetical protein